MPIGLYDLVLYNILVFLSINIFTAELVLWQLLCFGIVFLLAYKLFSLFANRFLHFN
jgi:hypothetical protein